MSPVPTAVSITIDTPLLGIEIGGTKLQLAAGNASGEILERVRFHIDREAGAEGIRKHMSAALPGLVDKWNPAAIGVGYGGPVSWKTGRIACSHHIEGWSNFPLGEWLSEITGVPSYVENDANTAALGEARYGAGKGAEPVLWINAGSGIGGGLVVNGQIYHGAPPGEIEIGHLRLSRDGTITEDLASGWSVDQMVRAAISREPDGALARALDQSKPSTEAPPQPGGEARALGPALAAGDTTAARLLDEIAASLAYALSHAVHLLHPEVIVFGGGLALIGEPLRSRIETTLPRWLMGAFLPGPQIKLAALMEDAVLSGSFAVAWDRICKKG